MQGDTREGEAHRRPDCGGEECGPQAEEGRVEQQPALSRIEHES